VTTTDEFTNRVANLCGDTVRFLEHLAKVLEDEGFDPQAELCETFIQKHKKLAYDCAVVTQNIEGEPDSPNESK